eukprot:SAG31_NODE_11745_length_1001_cov_1.514412_1_plen_66_part_10
MTGSQAPVVVGKRNIPPAAWESYSSTVSEGRAVGPSTSRWEQRQKLRLQLRPGARGHARGLGAQPS